jgi:hypothetical protein
VYWSVQGTHNIYVGAHLLTGGALKRAVVPPDDVTSTPVGVVIVAAAYAVALYMVQDSYRAQGGAFARDVLTALVAGLIWAGLPWLFEIVKGFH